MTDQAKENRWLMIYRDCTTASFILQFQTESDDDTG
jgi:hypothetical protein